jgi:hypothetical protein
MSGLHVLVVTSYGDHTALTGGRLRRDNVVRGLRTSGHTVDRLDVPARPGPRSAARATWMSMMPAFRRRVRAADVVLVGDVFCLPTMPVLRRMGVPVLVDLVDSPYRLVGSAPRSTVRERLSAAAQDAQLVPVMQVLLPMADAVSYISDEDVSADAERVRRLPTSYVVPNGIHPELSAVELEAPPEDGYLAWLADWTYPPNQESLRWFTREVVPLLPDEVLARVTLFGNGEPWATAHVGEDAGRAAAVMARGGFVEELADVYRGSRAVVAPVTRGAGMNNKVLEPLAAGRELLTTSVGVRGLSDAIREGVRQADDGPTFVRELEEMLGEPWDRARAEKARESVSAMSWERSGKEMDVAVREVAARGRQRAASIR